MSNARRNCRVGRRCAACSAFGCTIHAPHLTGARRCEDNVRDASSDYAFDAILAGNVVESLSDIKTGRTGKHAGSVGDGVEVTLRSSSKYSAALFAACARLNLETAHSI